MAITGTNRGAVIGTDSGSNVTFSPTSNYTSGSYAIICIVKDGPGAASVTDSHGNTWELLVDVNETVADDHNLAVYMSDLSAGNLTTSSVVTAVGTQNDVVCTFHEIITSVYPLSYVTGGTGASRTSGNISITTSSIPTDDLTVCAYGKEDSSSFTADGDSTNGSWSTAMTATDTTVDGLLLSSQRKIVTGTGTQTYNPTGLGSTGSRLIAWTQFTELAPSSSLDPFGTFGIFGI